MRNSKPPFHTFSSIQIPLQEKGQYDFVGILLVAISISISTSSLLSRWWGSRLFIFQWHLTKLGFLSFLVWPSPSLSSTQQETVVYPWKSLPLCPYHSPNENVPVASFLFQGSAYTLYPELQSPSWPSHAMAFISLLTMLLARLQGSLVFLCVQCFLPHPSHPDSPRTLLTHHFPCRSPLPSSPLSRLRWESLNGNFYYTVSLLMTSLVTLSYISLSLLHQFLEHSSADCYRCLLCGYHSGLQVFNKQELKSTFYKCDLFPALGISLSLMGFLAAVVISHQHFAECSLHIIHSLCILNT